MVFAGERLGSRTHVLAQLARSCACLSFMDDRTPWDVTGSSGDAIGCSATLCGCEAMFEQGHDARRSAC